MGRIGRNSHDKCLACQFLYSEVVDSVHLVIYSVIMDACDEIVGWQNVAAFVLFNQNAPWLVGANKDKFCNITAPYHAV